MTPDEIARRDLSRELQARYAAAPGNGSLLDHMLDCFLAERAAREKAEARATELLTDVNRSLQKMNAMQDDMLAAIDRAEQAEALISECEKYLKPDETPRQRMDRDFREMQGLVDLLTKARLRAEKAEAERDEYRQAANLGHAAWMDAEKEARTARADALREAAAVATRRANQCAEASARAETEGRDAASETQAELANENLDTARAILALIDKPQEVEANDAG